MHVGIGEHIRSMSAWGDILIHVGLGKHIDPSQHGGIY